MKKFYNFYFASVVALLFSFALSSAQAQLRIAAIQNDLILLLDPTDGTIVDPSFIDLTPLNPTTPKALIQVDDEIWVADQIADRIDRFDLTGAHLGQLTSGFDNIKGMTVVNNNEVWVTNSGSSNGAPGDAIIRLDFNGNVLGNHLTGGDTSFDVYDNGSGEVYVSYIDNDRIEIRDYSGNVLGDLVTTGVVNFPQQMHVTSTGDVLCGAFSPSSGVYLFSETNGSTIDYWPASGVRGVMELDNNNILYSNSSGISILDPNTGTSSTLSAGSSQYFGKVQLNCAVDPTSAPTGNTTQDFCGSATVADLHATGFYIQWYDAATGGSQLSSSDALNNGTTYYASQTVVGCESTNRLAVTANVNDPSAPTGNATQDFCGGATVADLSATGSNIQWYDASTGGTLLSSSDALSNGTTYYASQTVSGCESTNRLAVAVNVNDPAAPSGNATQSFCNVATVADLVATGSNIQWYDASTGGTLLSSSDALSNGTTYYASQTVSGCESTSRLAVAVNVNDPAAPSGNATQDFCNGATIADLVATGSNIQWYDASTGGALLSSSNALSNGTTYYASQTISGCESQNRLAVDVTINTVTPVTGNASQTITVVNASDATIADLVVSPTGVTWYASASDAQAGTNALPVSTVITDDTTYYAVNEENGCTSAPFAVTVTVETTSSIDGFDSQSLLLYPNPAQNILNIEYSDVIDKVQVMNITGQIVITENPYKQKAVLDLSPLPAAIYFVKVMSGGKTKTVKLVKQD